MTWKGFSNIWGGCQWTTTTNSFSPMKFKFKIGECISHPIMFPSPRVLWPPSVVIISNTIVTIFSNSLTSENENASTIIIQSGAHHPLMDLGPSCVNIQPYCGIEEL